MSKEETIILERFANKADSYATAVWFNDTLYEDWPNTAMILTDEQYEDSSFKEECFVAGFFCKNNKVIVLKNCSEGDYLEFPFSKCNPEFRALMLEYILNSKNIDTGL